MEALIVIFGAAGVVWLAVLLARGGLVAGALVTLAAGTCCGAFFFSLPTGAIPLTLDRALLVVVFAQCVLYGRLRWTQPLRLTWFDVVLAVFVVLLAFSTLSHDWSRNNNLPLARWTFYYLMPAVLYWIARRTKLSDRACWAIVGSFALFGVYLAATAIAEVAGPGWLVWPRYIGSETFAEFLGRARGPVMNPAGNGLLLTAALVSALLWWERFGLVGRGLLAAVVLLLAAGLYCTLTRSVWIGAGLAVLIVAACKLPRSWRWPAVACSLALSLVMTAVLWDRLTEFKRDKQVSSSDMAESAKLRPLLATVAWQMFADRPLFGCGYGQYLPSSRPYFSERTSELPIEKARPYVQHNIVLALLTETGLVGAGLLTALLLGWASQGWRLWRNTQLPRASRQLGLLLLGSLAAYVTNGMFHDVTIIPMMNMLLFFLAGTVAAAATAQPTRSHAAADRRQLELQATS